MAVCEQILPWCCGRCGMEYALDGRLVVCAECRHALCETCRVRAQLGGEWVTYCRACARRLGVSVDDPRNNLAKLKLFPGTGQ